MARRIIILLAGLLALLVGRVDAKTGQYNNCSETVGTGVASILFPSPTFVGPPQPTEYLALQNNSTSNQVIWFNAWGSPAAMAAPSWSLAPGAGFNFTGEESIPATVSVIGTASGAALTCFYR